MAATLTLEELGRMYGSSPEEIGRAREHFREAIEYLGIPLEGDPRDSYDSLANVLFSQAEIPIEFQGEGNRTSLILGNNGKSVVVGK